MYVIGNLIIELQCGGVTSDGRKLRQQEFQEKRELLEFTESQVNQLTYEIKEEIKQHTEEVERKVCSSILLWPPLIR